MVATVKKDIDARKADKHRVRGGCHGSNLMVSANGLFVEAGVDNTRYASLQLDQMHATHRMDLVGGGRFECDGREPFTAAG